MLKETNTITMLHAEATRLLKEKKTDDEIVAYLVSTGCEKHYAETVLDNTKEDAADKISFRKTFLYGLGFLIAGVLVSFSSFYFARSMGAMFYLFYWGLIVAGISIETM